jgi:hypothetical protein
MVFLTMKQIKSEKIKTIERRFRHTRQWLLIDVDKMDEKTTTPLYGRLIAHSTNKDKLYDLVLKSPRKVKHPFIDYAGSLPKNQYYAL